jgi:WD40 repeat protein
VFEQGAAAGEQRLTTNLKSITSIAGGGPAKTITSGGGKINALAVSPDGALVAIVSQDGVCRLFDFGSGRLVGGFKVRGFDARPGGACLSAGRVLLPAAVRLGSS